MAEASYRVVFMGALAEGQTAPEVQKKLSVAFGISDAMANRLFSGKPVVLKKKGTRQQCEAIRDTVVAAGGECIIEPLPDYDISEGPDPQSAHNESDFSPNSAVPPPLPPPEKRGTISIQPPPHVRQPDEKFCDACRAIVKINSLACPKCGQKMKKSEGLPGCAIAGIVIGISFFALAVIGILAAIAIPSFISYRTKAADAAILSELYSLQATQETYFLKNGEYSASLEALEYEPAETGVSVTIVGADENCFKARGTSVKTPKIFWIDCEGLTGETDEDGKTTQADED